MASRDHPASGSPLNRTSRVGARIRSLGVFVLDQRRLLQDIGPGLAHAFVFWGFVVLATTGNYITNGLVETIVGWPLGGFFWSVVVLFANVFIGLVLASVVYYVIRRTIVRPARLALTRDAFVILSLIFLIVLTEWVGDAFAYVVEPDHFARPWALLAGPLSLALAPIGASAAAVGYGFGWSHILLVLAFGAYLPYSKHLHILSSEPNVYFRNLEPRGAAQDGPRGRARRGRGPPVFGARTLEDLTWRHLLDPLARTECGRCMELCPASVTGKTLSPKHLMEGLRDQIWAAETALAAAASAQRAWKGADGGAAAAEDALELARSRAEEALTLPLVDNAIPEEAVWQCTTCGWCVEGCPVLIEHVDTIVEIRRNAVLEESRFPKELNAAFRNMENAGNPWGQPRSSRLDWAKGLDVPVLGDISELRSSSATADAGGPCSSPRRRPTRSPGASSTGSAAPEPSTTGTGGSFAPWPSCSDRRVCRSPCSDRWRPAAATPPAGPVTSTSSRCWRRRTSRRSRRPTPSTGSRRSSPPARTASIRSATYPQFGLRPGHPPHAASRPARGRGPPRPVGAPRGGRRIPRRVLPRTLQPGLRRGRRVVESVPGQSVVEMDLHHRRGCCGAGGARMWMEEREGTRINHKRVERHSRSHPTRSPPPARSA